MKKTWLACAVGALILGACDDRERSGAGWIAPSVSESLLDKREVSPSFSERPFAPIDMPKIFPEVAPAPPFAQTPQENRPNQEAPTDKAPIVVPPVFKPDVQPSPYLPPQQYAPKLPPKLNQPAEQPELPKVNSPQANPPVEKNENNHEKEQDKQDLPAPSVPPMQNQPEKVPESNAPEKSPQENTPDNAPKQQAPQPPARSLTTEQRNQQAGNKLHSTMPQADEETWDSSPRFPEYDGKVKRRIWKYDTDVSKTINDYVKNPETYQESLQKAPEPQAWVENLNDKDAIERGKYLQGDISIQKYLANPVLSEEVPIRPMTWVDSEDGVVPDATLQSLEKDRELTGKMSNEQGKAPQAEKEQEKGEENQPKDGQNSGKKSEEEDQSKDKKQKNVPESSWQGISASQ